MKAATLTVEPREQSRRNLVKKLRGRDIVPAVIYGRAHESKKLQFGLKDFQQLLHHSVSETIVVDLTIGEDTSSTQLAIVKDVQHHPLSGKILHVDFQAVAEDELVTATVPLEATGEAVGVKTDGGVLGHTLFEVGVRATPRNLPEVVRVDVSDLSIGQSIHVSDLPQLEGVEYLEDAEVTVFAVSAPTVAAEPEAAEEGEPAVVGEEGEAAESGEAQASGDQEAKGS